MPGTLSMLRENTILMGSQSTLSGVSFNRTGQNSFISGEKKNQANHYFVFITFHLTSACCFQTNPKSNCCLTCPFLQTHAASIHFVGMVETSYGYPFFTLNNNASVRTEKFKPCVVVFWVCVVKALMYAVRLSLSFG